MSNFKPNKIEMETYTLSLTKETANNLRELAHINKRSVAWILREMAAEMLKNAEFLKNIGLVNQ